MNIGKNTHSSCPFPFGSERISSHFPAHVTHLKVHPHLIINHTLRKCGLTLQSLTLLYLIILSHSPFFFFPFPGLLWIPQPTLSFFLSPSRCSSDSLTQFFFSVLFTSQRSLWVCSGTFSLSQITQTFESFCLCWDLKSDLRVFGFIPVCARSQI